MAFTSIELVRAHLTDARIGDLRILDESIVLSGTAAGTLSRSGIVPGSVTVKAQRSDVPIREVRVLAGTWVNLEHGHLIAGSVVVANDGSLGRMYVENIDYVVDVIGGRIKRVEAGAIESGQEVVIWYLLYHVYVEGDDFRVDAARGTIARRSSGAIADGQWVLVDYNVALSAVSDTVIEQAIAESGEAVLALVDPGHHESPTPAIVIGATHWAVAMVGRMRAGSVLSGNPISSTEARVAAQTWLEIAQKYEASGREFLARFAALLPSRQPIRRG